VPAVDERDPGPLSEPVSAVRNTLNAVRYDWLGVRIGGPGESMRGQWPVLLVAALLVFGCSFAIGHVFAARRGASSHEGSSAAPISRATIPAQLAGASPLAAVPSSIAEPPPPPPKPARRRGGEALRAGAPTQASAGERAAAEATSQAGSEPAPEAQAKPAPAPTSGGGGGSTGAKRAGGRSRAGSGGAGGGSFDSSE
jgi:hypothetical protein